jgi:death-on-curing protein
MNEPIWVRRDVIELLHTQSIAEHGGADGLRDEGLLESALARPKNLFAYEEVGGPSRLAASYTFGLAKNHPFVDGNKRTAFIAAGLFLRLNGYRLIADQAQATLVILSVAAGSFGEEELTAWIRKNVEAL